ncbi:MAG: insulinase family protein [Candidatus Competibacteraceae bacterium]|nr:insulinase family protein [Candidatus Competibacteraceae bacterium]MBK7983741.1 insulinase family protein [Candidatus Competibacteraceae bacterium]MBK8897717.1 insulinase family protein [Candidatus Competibacteraceae bacterium]MBK8961522.1 insulinase family protein [Candidatus Competibacteraceae bacterium]
MLSSVKHALTSLLATALLLTAGLAAAVPAIQNWRTANGVSVYFIPARELPMVDAQILFNAGSIRDGAQPGLAKLTNALLEEGAGDWSADVIADRLDQVGAQVSFSSRRDSASVSLRSLIEPRYLQPAVETVARLLKEPRFAPDAVERVRQQLLIALRERAQSPGAIAQDAFFKTLYGAHPYASPPEGQPASLNAITRADIENFHRRYYTAANAVVAIVGDLDRSAAEQLASRLVDGLAKGEPVPPPPPVSAVTASQTIRIPHPSSQSHILIGQLGVKRGDPDYYALFLGNHVLGGNGLVSQLSQEIREKRGLAYGAYSAFSPMQQAGPFLMNLQTRNDQADTALQVAQSTLRDFTDHGPSTQALEEARQNITGGFALDLAGNGKLVGALGMIAFHGLPLDYLQNYIGTMNGITLEQAKTAWQRQVRPDKLITVIVGGGQPAPTSPDTPAKPAGS